MNILKNFDFMSTLYKTNPVAYEEYCNDIISEYMNTFPPKKADQLAQQQQQITSALANCDTIDDRMQMISSMLYHKMKALAHAIAKLS